MTLMYNSRHVALCQPATATAAPIGGYLTDHGFEVTPVTTSYRLDRLLAERGADLVILDTDLADADPLALTRRLSERNRVGILLLASGPDCLARICGLEAGADDCLAKPAELREVLARVKAILRRLSKVRDAELQRRESDGVLLGDARFDIANRRLMASDGLQIGITDMEFALLKTFAENPNRALTRDELAAMSYGRPWSPLDRSLDIRISRLRRKLERDPARPEIIVTVRGIGYRYEARA
jgi:two-component system, OmpR family, phosphate regulon response regulator OmpR